MKLNLDHAKLDIFCKYLQQKVDSFQVNNQETHFELKADASEVTKLDLLLSDSIKDFLEFIPGDYYSEEDHIHLIFPCKIVDPLDGTKEFIKGSDEWSISILMAHSSQLDDSKNEALIFQPKTGFIQSHLSAPTPNIPVNKILVSKSEWLAGQHPKSLENNLIEPCGSIALKLAKLVNGEALAVCSLRPKHVWDIAAGSVLLFRNGFNFYSEGKKVTNLDKKLFMPPLLWVKKENESKLPMFYREHLGKDH